MGLHFLTAFDPTIFFSTTAHLRGESEVVKTPQWSSPATQTLGPTPPAAQALSKPWTASRKVHCTDCRPLSRLLAHQILGFCCHMVAISEHCMQPLVPEKLYSLFFFLDTLDL